MKPFLLVAALSSLAIHTAVSGQTLPAKWEPVFKTDEVSVYLDRKTARLAPLGGRAWIMFTYGQPQVADDTFQSYSVLEAFNCLDKTISSLRRADYAGPNSQGKTVKTFKYPNWQNSFTEVVADSKDESILKSFCAFRESKQ